MIVAVVMAAGDPIHARLLFQSCEHASVTSLAVARLLGVTVELEVIKQILVLNQWNMHEEHSFAFARVSLRDVAVCLTEPVDLVWMDAVVVCVHSETAHIPRIQKPESRNDLITFKVINR